jgi:hypothetical protein
VERRRRIADSSPGDVADSTAVEKRGWSPTSMDEVYSEQGAVREESAP